MRSGYRQKPNPVACTDKAPELRAPTCLLSMLSKRSCTLVKIVGIIGKAPSLRKFSDFRNESTRLIVRVMIAGREIDRIECAHQGSTGEHLVRYRRRDWPVHNGCIHVDSLPSMPMLWDGKPAQDHLSLFEAPLPRQLIDCTVWLRSEFPALGDAAILAVATLAQLGLDLLAKETLVDFLKLHNDARQFGHEPSLVSDTSPAMRLKAQPMNAVILSSSIGEADDWAVNWLPQQGWEAPKQDDSELRKLAGQTQSQIGAHVAATPDAYAIDFSDMPDGDDWQIFISEVPQSAVARNTTELPRGHLEAGDVIGSSLGDTATPRTSSLPAQHLTFIAEQAALLGETALEVLRYFVDNPGDNSSHAELVTGGSRGMINGLLNGSLSRYVQKTSSGGWSCHSWVPDVLAVIDDRQ